MTWAESCAIPTTVHVELPDSARVQMWVTDDGGELVIGSTTFTISRALARRIGCGLAADVIDADLLEHGDMDDLYGRWYRLNRPTKRKGPSR